MAEQESTKYARIARETNNKDVRDKALGKWFKASKKEGKSWILGQPLWLPSGQVNGEVLLRILLLVLFLPIILDVFICKAIPLRGVLFLIKIPIFFAILVFEILLIIFIVYCFSVDDFKTALQNTFNFVREFISSVKN
jgi:hypothetical protein